MERVAYLVKEQPIRIKPVLVKVKIDDGTMCSTNRTSFSKLFVGFIPPVANQYLASSEISKLRFSKVHPLHHYKAF